MNTSMRAKDIVSRFLNARPADESIDAFCRRLGLPRTISVDKLRNRRDISTGLLYQICRAFGYQIMIYNPNPPEGLEKCYIIDKKFSPVKAREDKRSKVRVTHDTYTNDVYHAVRKYRRKRKDFNRVA